MTRSILALGMIGLMLSASLSSALSQEPARDPRYLVELISFAAVK